MVGVDTPPAAPPTAAGTDDVEDDTEGDSKGAMAFILQCKEDLSDAPLFDYICQACFLAV